MPYVALQSMLDATAPHGGRYYDRLHYLERVSDGLIDTLVAAFEDVPAPEAHVITGWMGGAVGRVPAGATAFGHRGAGAETWFIGASGSAPLEPVVAWVRRAVDATARFATGGTYVNALEEGGAIGRAYEHGVLARLAEVKRRYDPDGAFSAVGIG
jgi:FAD/FMN-containing dehydrogenase